MVLKLSYFSKKNIAFGAWDFHPLTTHPVYCFSSMPHLLSLKFLPTPLGMNQSNSFQM